MSLPDSVDWRAEIIENSCIKSYTVVGGNYTFNMADKESAEKLVEVLNGKEDELYAGWERSMGDDL